MSGLRLIARFVGIVWALALAALSLGIALYCLDGLIGLGGARPDRLLHLVTARRETGHLLAQLQASGHVAILSLLCGVGAVIVGLLLLKGLLTGPRERSAILDEDASGVLAARRRPLIQMLRALSADPREVREVRRVKLSLKRRGSGGRMKLDAIRERGSDRASAEGSIERALDPIANPFRLKARITTSLSAAARRQRS